MLYKKTMSSYLIPVDVPKSATRAPICSLIVVFLEQCRAEAISLILHYLYIPFLLLLADIVLSFVLDSSSVFSVFLDACIFTFYIAFFLAIILIFFTGYWFNARIMTKLMSGGVYAATGKMQKADSKRVMRTGTVDGILSNDPTTKLTFQMPSKIYNSRFIGLSLDHVFSRPMNQASWDDFIVITDKKLWCVAIGYTNEGDIWISNRISGCFLPAGELNKRAAEIIAKMKADTQYK